MVEERWTYTSPRGLMQCYGHVDYYGSYVIGQWFVLDPETGRELWARRFLRPNTISGYDREVIVASELRSDGPWTLSFGIYGIAVDSGRLLWVNHGPGVWGKILRGLDAMPGFTNEFRDVSKCVENGLVFTERGRVLDVLTGHDIQSTESPRPGEGKTMSRAESLYHTKSVTIGGDALRVESAHDSFEVTRQDSAGQVLWRFSPHDHGACVDSNYYSYRLHQDRLFLILGRPPAGAHESAMGIQEPTPVQTDYRLGVLHLSSGELDELPLAHATPCKTCRIETIRDNRLLVSCDQTHLTEYRI